jgi:hypothetical protein
MIGRLYKLVSKQTDKVYYGSTERTLEIRFSHHKSSFKNGTIKGCSSKEILCYDDCEIILLDIVEVSNKKELRKYERIYIENNECVNKRIPNRTKKEYRLENIDKAKEYRLENIDKLKDYLKNYREKNNNILKEKKKEKMTCICGIDFTKNHKSRHERSQFHCEFIQSAI